MEFQNAFGTRQKYSKPRVGRGGKRGTTAGKGTKGQKARAGRRIRPAERDYIQRLPKLRGFNNKSRRAKPIALNLKSLEKAVDGTIVNLETIRAKGVMHVARGREVKILGSGTITKPFVIQNLKVSASARKAIEAAGGTVVS